MDKSWMGENRTSQRYVRGVKAFMDYAQANLRKTRQINPGADIKHLTMPCPCTNCLNRIPQQMEDVDFHLFKYGIDLNYTTWTKHGEEEEPSSRDVPNPGNATTFSFDNTDFESEIPTDAPETIEMVNATVENFEENPEKFHELLLDAEKPLYEGCPDFTKLSAIVQLFNLKGKYGVSDKFFTELLRLLKKMLPPGNELVESSYEAKKVMKLLGSGYQKIHA